MNITLKRSFTLIEMMLVVLIIALLAGMTFKLYGLVMRNAALAKTVGVLEKINYALEEYRAEYGMYPPTDHTRYSMCPDDSMNTDPRALFWLSKPEKWGDWEYRTYDPNGDGSVEKQSLFGYGLASYLCERLGGSVDEKGNRSVPMFTKGWIDDETRDEEAKKRWSKYIADIVVTVPESGSAVPGLKIVVSNNAKTFFDAYGRDVIYSCPKPYLKYKLYSAGPDGYSGNSDDIHRDKWDN